MGPGCEHIWGKTEMVLFLPSFSRLKTSNFTSGWVKDRTKGGPGVSRVMTS